MGALTGKENIAGGGEWLRDGLQRDGSIAWRNVFRVEHEACASLERSRRCSSDDDNVVSGRCFARSERQWRVRDGVEAEWERSEVGRVSMVHRRNSRR